MSRRIGKYTIQESKKHPLNLEVLVDVKKTIKTQLVADKMNEKDFKNLPEGHGIRPHEVDDTYEKQEFIGYFPKSTPEKAFERVYSLLVADGCGMADSSIAALDMVDLVKVSRSAVLEAAKGVRV